MLRIFYGVISFVFLSANAYAQFNQDVIIISASRSEEKKDQTSTSISVLDGDEIELVAAHHSAESLNRVSGVLIQRGNGVEHLTAIRSPVLTGGAGAGSFLYLEDGIALRAPGFANINGLLDALDGLASQIEVIKGPGPAIYGSNALHGVINILTPDPAKAESRFNAELGSFGRYNLKAQTGIDTSYGSSWLGFSFRHEHGWRDDAGLSKAGLQMRHDGGAGPTRWSFRTSLVDIDQETASFAEGFEIYKDKTQARKNDDPLAFRNVSSARASARLDHKFSDHVSGQLTGYLRSTDMDFRMHFLPSLALELTGHDSVGLQSSLTWQQDHHRVIAGLDIDRTNGYLYEYQDAPTRFSFVQGLHYDYNVNAKTYAGFIQVRSEVLSALNIEYGLRLEHSQYDYDNNAPDGFVGRYLRLADRKDDYMVLTPNLGAIYQISSNLQFVIRASKGARVPQTTELYRLQPGQEIASIKPETLDSFELGWRWSVDERLALGLNAFAMNKTNVFFRDADGFNVTDGKTNHHGVEFDAGLTLTPSLSVSMSGSWSNHEYAFDRPVRSVSSSITKGDQIDTAPNWLWNAKLHWMANDNLQAQAEWVHVGAYYLDPGNTASYSGHDIANLRMRYALNARVNLTASLRNAFDVRYAERADFAFGRYRYFPAEPQALSIGISISH